MTIKAPPYRPIKPIAISPRWFPPGRSFGLYEHNGVCLPNVTSILAESFPFDKSKWEEVEPDIDHDAVARESAERGTRVHEAMENWLAGYQNGYDPQYAPWVQPLRQLVSRATATLAVEIPLHHQVAGVGGYAGSCDGLMLAGEDVVIIDYKTKRPNKKVHPKFLDKQRLQLAAYATAINEIYGNQLPSPVARVSLLFAHPDEGRAPTVVSTGGDELVEYQMLWAEMLANWWDARGEEIAAEQAAFNAQQQAA